MVRLREPFEPLLVEPLDWRVAPLVVEAALDPEVLPALEPAPLPAPAEPDEGAPALGDEGGEAGAADGGAGGVDGGAAAAGGAAGGAAAAGGAGGEEGVPKPGAVHAQAMLAPATTTPSTESTAKQAMRTCLCITPSPNFSYEQRT